VGGQPPDVINGALGDHETHRTTIEGGCGLLG
jgi:hypothetical protein